MKAMGISEIQNLYLNECIILAELSVAQELLRTRTNLHFSSSEALNSSALMQIGSKINYGN